MIEDTKKQLNIFFEECFYSILKHEQISVSGSGLGLSINEIHLISAISRNKDTKAVNISKTLKITAGSLTVAANTLIAKGFIIRKQDNLDKRVYRLYLTKKGEEVNRLHSKYHNSLIETVTERLNESELSALMAALEKIKEFTRVE